MASDVLDEIRVYLAGPDVFLPEAGALAERKRKLCADYGFVGKSPLDNEISLEGLSQHEAALRIGAANEDMIRSCQLVIANLTPFRGPSADVGTAYEIGFARALGLLVFGYTNVAGTLLDRTRQALGAQVTREPTSRYADAYRMAVEDFDCIDNLMLVIAVEGSGSHIVVNPTAEDSRFTDLAGFDACLRLAAEQRDAGRDGKGRARGSSPSRTAR
jgi:nucleoside 2-deoxyribosyltransferase